MFASYDYYRIFYYVALYGNVTQASKILLNSQPNLTRSIKTLESELGCNLFIRNNKGMKLTEEGEKLFERVRVAVESIEAGEEEIAKRKNLGEGSVYVAASEIALRYFLLPVLKEFRTLYPGIRLKIGNHSTPQAMESIKNGIADVAVVTTPTEVVPKTKQTTVCSFSEVAICGSAFSELATGKVSFEKLLTYPIISLGAQTKSFELYSEFFFGQGLKYRPEIEAAGAEQIIPMVKADLGIGFVPKKFIKESDGIYVIDTEKPLPKREIRMVKRSDRTLCLAAKELEKLILQNSFPCD